jgi:uncharacterized membrane protein YuzA (DUF378 family)
MDAFSLDTDQATRRLFWTVFVVLGAVTYALATIGLFGFHLVATKRKELTGLITSRWNDIVTMLKKRRRNQNSETNNN